MNERSLVRKLYNSVGSMA
jgi:hypothetical protein